MSKIYTGFRMNRHEFPAVLEDLQKAMKALGDHAEELQGKFLGRRAIGLIDRFQMSVQRGEKVKSITHGAMVAATMEMFERQRKMRADLSRDPLVDFDIKLTLWYSKSTNSYVGRVSAESQDAYRIFMRSGVAEDFSYWSNTDAPDNLNARQWKKRGAVWDEVLRTRALPAITVQVPEPGFMSNQDAVQYVPTFEKRVNSVALDVALQDWWKVENAEGAKQLTVGRCGSFMCEAVEPGTEAHRYFEAARKEVELVLVKEVTKEMLGERYIAPPELEKEAEKKTTT